MTGARARRPIRTRLLATGALAVIVALVACSPTPPRGDITTALPTFTYAGQVLDVQRLTYAPTGEFIFPSVVRAGEYFEEPLGEWYLYYSPHESPGGIALAYADSLAGPWTEFEGNPLISNTWGSHFDVSHVSSADAVWNDTAESLFLYFHGENDTTRFATSDDGLHFEYGGVAVERAGGNPDITESSYARVFEHPDPDSSYSFAMLFMDNTQADVRRIRVAESRDGRTWDVRPEPLITPGSAERYNASSANLMGYEDQLYVIYHGSTGTILARRTDATLSQIGDPVLVYPTTASGGEGVRAAAPEIVSDGGTTVLFYESGPRLSASIGMAVLDPSVLE